MPLYEYLCDECGYFQEFKTVADRNNCVCQCGRQAQKLLSAPQGLMIDGQIKDMGGTPIWFPKDGQPYYDRALKKTFTSKKQKAEYMKQKKLVMDGSESSPNWSRIPEAGDMRSKEYRKRMRMED